MLLAIDIGNTNIVFGLFEKIHLRDQLRLSTRHTLTHDEIGLAVTTWLAQMGETNEEIDQVIIANVVPPVTFAFETFAKKYLGCEPIFVSHQLKLPIKIDIDEPSQVGADRIANAVAGFTKFGAPVIVVDFGTTTNFDIVSDKAAYIGGVLIPGPQTAMTELARKAARLFEVKIEPPAKVIGRNTTDALKSGFFFGTVGQVDYLLDKILEETGFTKCPVIATGGFSGKIANYSRHIKLTDPTLTLEGLKIIAEGN